MTKEQIELLREMGPYTMTTEGILLDANGVSIGYTLMPPASDEQRKWVGAALAAINEACARAAWGEP